MDMLGAMKETIAVARRRSIPAVGNTELRVNSLDTSGPCSIQHFEKMLAEAKVLDYSEAKLGRHLGFIQGVCCAAGLFTLEELKDLNRSFA